MFLHLTQISQGINGNLLNNNLIIYFTPAQVLSVSLGTGHQDCKRIESQSKHKFNQNLQHK